MTGPTIGTQQPAEFASKLLQEGKRLNQRLEEGSADADRVSDLLAEVQLMRRSVLRPLQTDVQGSATRLHQINQELGEVLIRAEVSSFRAGIEDQIAPGAFAVEGGVNAWTLRAGGSRSGLVKDAKIEVSRNGESIHDNLPLPNVSEAQVKALIERAVGVDADKLDTLFQPILSLAEAISKQEGDVDAADASVSKRKDALLARSGAASLIIDLLDSADGPPAPNGMAQVIGEFGAEMGRQVVRAGGEVGAAAGMMALIADGIRFLMSVGSKKESAADLAFHGSRAVATGWLVVEPATGALASLIVALWGAVRCVSGARAVTKAERQEAQARSSLTGLEVKLQEQAQQVGAGLLELQTSS